MFDPDLPWKEKPMKVNSVIDVHVSIKHVIENILGREVIRCKFRGRMQCLHSNPLG